jgi:hypothetical protein
LALDAFGLGTCENSAINYKKKRHEKCHGKAIRKNEKSQHFAPQFTTSTSCSSSYSEIF